MARDPVLNFQPANQLLDVVELSSWNTVKIISVHKKFGKKYELINQKDEERTRGTN